MSMINHSYISIECFDLITSALFLCKMKSLYMSQCTVARLHELRGVSEKEGQSLRLGGLMQLCDTIAFHVSVIYLLQLYHAVKFSL